MSFPDAKRSAKTMGAVLDEELAEDVAPDVRAMANAIVAAHGGSVAAVLLYGSCLRDSSTAGVLDFYVLVDDYRAYHRRAMPALFNFLLPPTVSQWRIRGSSGPLRAKVAVISRAQFRRRMNARNLDTSLWIRFCQPCALVYRRDTETADWVVETLGQAISTAAEWAVRLGPAEGEPGSYWRALFRNSYRAELRVERSADRGATIYEAAAARYDRLLL